MHSMQLRCKPSIALGSFLLSSSFLRFFFPLAFLFREPSSRAPIRESSQPFIIEMQRAACSIAPPPPPSPSTCMRETNERPVISSIGPHDCIVFARESTLYRRPRDLCQIDALANRKKAIVFSSWLKSTLAQRFPMWNRSKDTI